MGRALAHGWIAWVGCGLLLAGCAKPTERLNAPPQGHTCYPSALQDNYTPMTDNAMMADMSMSSIHFVPHTSELNGAGVRRLDRYASLLKMYGGTLNYDGVEEESLAKARVDRISQFLTCAGVAPDKFDVKRGLAGGEGLRAVEASYIREGSSYKPPTQGPQGQSAEPASTEIK